MELVVLFGLIAVGCGGFLLYIVTPKGKDGLVLYKA